MKPLLADAPHPRTGRPGFWFAGVRFDRLGPLWPADIPWFEKNAPTPPGGWTARAEESRRRCEQRRREIGLDGGTADTLFRVLSAYANKEVLLLEGPPAVAKTSTIELAASLLGLSIYRVSFSASSEPDAVLGGREPTGGDDPFPWFDGALVLALRHGGVAYLDEVNLARPAQLDGLLPALERYPTITLPRHMGCELVAGHPDFRVIASVNSAEDTEGRVPMSRPFRSRFTTFFVRAADAAALEAGVRHWIFGRPADEVSLYGNVWAADRLGPSEVLFPHLTRVSGIEELIHTVTRFTFEVDRRCSDPSHPIGQDRLEPYAFDRRKLAHFFEAMDRAAARAPVDGVPVAFGPEVERLLEHHYFRAVRPGTDEQQIRDQAKTLGLLNLPAPVLSPEGAPHRGRSPIVHQGLRGCDLEAWREATGASVDDAAALLGVTSLLVARMEGAPTTLLPSSVRQRLETLINEGWRRP